jgi:cob(I)alamin adenosyltransferase
MRIYTRTGDAGETTLWGGQRVSKAEARVEAVGTVDELNAALGLARTYLTEADLQTLLQTVQSELFDLGADLAAPLSQEEIAEIANCELRIADCRLRDEPTRPPAAHIGIPMPTSQPANQPTKEERQIPRLQPDRVAALERWIDGLEAELEPLRQFILPGGAPGAAALHLARTIARRAERRVVALAEVEEINPEALRYLNRLSDLLFVLARVVNRRAGAEEPTWAGFRW